MSNSILTANEQTRRERAVAESIHSGEMEDSRVTQAARADSAEYIAGKIDSDELVARTRARYGLD